MKDNGFPPVCFFPPTFRKDVCHRGSKNGGNFHTNADLAPGRARYPPLVHGKAALNVRPVAWRNLGPVFWSEKMESGFFGMKVYESLFFFKISLSGCQRVDFERFLSQVGEGKFATVGKGDFGRFIPYPPVNDHISHLWLKGKSSTQKDTMIVPCFFFRFSRSNLR